MNILISSQRTLMSAKSEEVVVDGKRLETLRLSPLSADASAPTIVMLHEGLGSISMWKVPQLEHRRIPRANHLPDLSNSR